MLGAFKDRWNSVQQDFSSGFQKFKQRKSPSIQNVLAVAVGSVDTPSTSQGRTVHSPVQIAQNSLNQNAGAELLYRNQVTWEETRQMSEENVKAADKASHELHKLQSKCYNAGSGLMRFRKEISGLHQVAENLSTLVAETARLQGLCEEVESGLAYLEVICDTGEHQEKRLDASFNFSLYREKKIAEFNEAKAKMAIDYMTEAEKKEKSREREQTEKQQLYQQAFETDLQLYRTTGLIANTIPGLEVQILNSKSPHKTQKSPKGASQSDSVGKGPNIERSRVSPNSMLRQLVHISHNENNISRSNYSHKKSIPNVGSDYEAAFERNRREEIAEILAGSQLRSVSPGIYDPPKALREQYLDISDNETDSDSGQDTTRDENDTRTGHNRVLSLGEEFVAGDIESFEKFLADVRLEDSGIGVSQSTSAADVPSTAAAHQQEHTQ